MIKSHPKKFFSRLGQFVLATALLISVSVAPATAGNVVPRVPGAPSVSSLVAGDKSFTITVIAPADSGSSAVTQYFYSLNDHAWVSLGPASIAGTAKLVRVSNNDIDYSVRVRAKNSAGQGAITNAGVVRPVAPPPVYPDAPTILSIQESSCHVLRVEIKAPTVTFGKITRYQFQLGDGYKWNNAWTTDGVKYIHTSLKRPFTLRVQAFNNAKNSGWGQIAEGSAPGGYPNCAYSR